MAQYSQDYDERMLIQKPDVGKHFGYILQPYVKSQQIFMCPSATGSVYNPLPAPHFPSDGLDHIWSYPATTPVSGAFTGSYGLNDTVGNNGTALSEFTNPSGTVLFADAEYPAGTLADQRMTNSARHLGGYAFCFADGHAKWLNKSTADAASLELFTPDL